MHEKNVESAKFEEAPPATYWTSPPAQRGKPQKLSTPTLNLAVIAMVKNGVGSEPGLAMHNKWCFGADAG